MLKTIGRYELVGTQDRFDEFATLLERRLGWRAVKARDKVNPRRPQLDEIERPLREADRGAQLARQLSLRACSARHDSAVSAAGAAP